MRSPQAVLLHRARIDVFAQILTGLAVLAMLAAHGHTLACGHCVEDKIAAVYDHAVITAAAAQNHHVAFFAIDGTMPTEASARGALQRAVSAARGIDRGSARISIELASLSLSFDPRRMSLAQVQRDLDRRLSAYRLSLLPLRILDRPAELKKAVTAR